MTEQKKAQPLGRILLRQKLISQNQLDSALANAKAGGMPLASQLIDEGILKEVDAVRALSEQHGVPGIDLSQVAIFLEHLVVPREVAEAHKILPVLVKGDRLFLAMADPSDKKVIDELEFVTGKKVYPYVALAGVLSKTISSSYDAKSQGETYHLGDSVSRETLRKLGLSGSSTNEAEGPPRMPSAPPEPLPVMDAKSERSAADVDITTREFGSLGTEDSSVTSLPTELRQRVNAAQNAATGPTTGKLVLVVDDEEEIRKLLRRLLTEKGYRVVEADRGLVALRMVKEHSPDVIILDAMLPEIHGFDIARRIKGSEKYGAIPIVMISAVYRGWRIAEDLKASYGIEEYLEKPFRMADVLGAVQRALTKSATATAAAPPTDPDAMNAEAEKALDAGIVAYKEGNIEEAIIQLKRGVAIDPLAFRLRFHLGLLFGKSGAIYEGIQELEKAIEINPKSFPALKNLAVLYEKAGFRHRAVEMWERCVNAAPDADTRRQIKEHLVGLL
ncbi:hypothetical protein BH09MYX1_BH09MYX1_41000 [soil metagenome]